MGCDFPMPAYRTEERSDSGKRKWTFNPRKSIFGYAVGKHELPCGKCTGCRLERSRQWAVRIMHEAHCHEFNSFITLTYDDQHVPEDYGLQLDHVQDFMKRLRGRVSTAHQGLKIRHFLCGEYGDLRGRPHYHAAIFGYDFPDKLQMGTNEHGQPIYNSALLADIWGMGGVSTAALEPGSAGYVARYSVKKINGAKAPDHYYRYSPVSGRMHNVRPEFATQSRRPGLGAAWLEKYRGDVYPSGFIVVDGVPQAPPKYYLSKLTDAERESLARQARNRNWDKRGEQTDARRYVKREVRDARIANLKRQTSGE